MLKMGQVSGIAGVAIVLALTGCGGGSSGGSGGETGTPTSGTGGSMSGANAFSQPLFAFDNEFDFTPEGLQDKVIRSKYSKASDVVSIKEEVVSGRELVPLETTYVMTRTQVLKTEGINEVAGVKSALMTDSTAKTYTIAPYTAGQGKSAGLVTFHYNVKPLSGLLLADSLNTSFALTPSQTLKLKHLRDSGKTFPTGSESLVISKVTNHEDTAEFASDEVTELKSVAEWEALYPEGTEFRHYMFKDLEVTCQHVVDVPLQDQTCIGSYGGLFYMVTVSPKGEYVLPSGVMVYFNQTAAASLTDGIQANYK
jgi:hypothetical protein